jgi:hypothetical protein
MRIERALADNPAGLRFTDLKLIAKLHQDTLSNRLEELARLGRIRRVDRVYRISKAGTEDLHRKYLIKQIAAPTSCVVVGGIEAGSIHRDETPILRSTMGFAFPAFSPSIVGELKKVVHKYWMLHALAYLARKKFIDPKCLIGDKPPKVLIDSLKGVLKDSKQTFAFIIDQKELKRNLNPAYIKEILRLAQIEDSSHIENKDSKFMEAFQLYAK